VDREPFLGELVASHRSSRSRESRDDFRTGIWSSQPDREAKRCVHVPKAETPKEHLRAIDNDHHVNHFQITDLV
jgi:hypothetical protein